MGKVTITAFKFDTPDGAGQMLELVQQLAREAQSSRSGELITLEDAAMVTWSPGDKKPRTRHLGDMTGAGALGGVFWGLLFGQIFFSEWQSQQRWGPWPANSRPTESTTGLSEAWVSRSSKAPRPCS